MINELEITQFFGYFRDALEFFKQIPPLNSYPPNKYGLLAQKMLCFSLIDALSIAKSGEDSSGQNFKCLVKEYSNYEHWEKISIPQLLYRLQKARKDIFQPLIDYAEKILSEAYTTYSYSINDDPPQPNLLEKFPKIDEEAKKIINHCSHIALFYKYRNTVVHEMRQPGYGYEFSRDKLPCYRSQTEVPGDRLTFQLTYPVNFFFRICEQCIQNLENYFLAQKRSPYDAYESKFGDVWK
jgi:hypothetical protein